MKKLYEKNELTFAIVWIVVYCALQSLANPLNKAIGVAYAASSAFCVLQTVVLFAFIRKNNLQKRYGLCKSPVPACRFLYYVPLIILASGNLWNGFALNYTPVETVCRIICMLCVGFLEEVIFRGLLFESIAKDNIKSAVIISSVTFGIGQSSTCSTAAAWILSITCARSFLPSRLDSCWSQSFIAAAACFPASSSIPPSTRSAPLQMT